VNGEKTPFDKLGGTKEELIQIRNRIAGSSTLLISPEEALQEYSNKIDQLIRRAFQWAQAQESVGSVCLMAVGGYGREELAPYSDIDLLLLHSSSRDEQLSSFIERVLYPLWDLGLEVSCSSRSIHECLKMAQSDLYIKTSLIDGRYLDGEYELFRNLNDPFSKKILYRNVKPFAEFLKQELHLRHKKYEDPHYILEPNVKEGIGGLRDFQIGRWLIRVRDETDRWDSILFPDFSRRLEKSIRFLWTIRIQLHLLSHRKQEDFTFELQEKIAPLLGFPNGTKGIEKMMRQYHLSAQRIASFVQDLLNHILREPSPLRKTFLPFRRKRMDENFEIAFGEIRLLHPMALKRDPTQLMTLFQYCQSYKVVMDFRLEEAILEALPFLDDRFRTSEKVNQIFLSLLRRGKNLGLLLRKMHDLGILSRYIPEFSEIEGLVHYDLYHIHPVDLHSILAVEELEKLKNGFYEKEYPLLTTLMEGLEKQEILFLTALLHDIGKGREEDHSLIGSVLGKRIAQRMGLSKEEQEWIGFLIQHHLLMLEVAFRRNLHDEQVILRFAKQIKEVHRLKMLYLLTFSDIRAVGPEAWTPWKNSLLMELFLKTSHLLEKGPPGELSSTFSSLPQASEYLEYLPLRYLSSYPPEEVAHHIEMARSIETHPFKVEWVIDQGTRGKLTICAKDQYGLFSKIAGCMFLNRIHILETQIHTWDNGIALDTFWVEDLTREIERRLEGFKKDLHRVLVEKIPLNDLISKREEPARLTPKVIPKVKKEVKINNEDSDFYTLIEVIGEDRMGILYEITRTLTDHGCNIHFAKASTLGNQIIDTFYVQDEWGEKITDRFKIDHLKKALLYQMS